MLCVLLLLSIAHPLKPVLPVPLLDGHPQATFPNIETMQQEECLSLCVCVWVCVGKG